MANVDPDRMYRDGLISAQRAFGDVGSSKSTQTSGSQPVQANDFSLAVKGDAHAQATLSTDGKTVESVTLVQRPDGEGASASIRRRR